MGMELSVKCFGGDTHKIKQFTPYWHLKKILSKRMQINMTLFPLMVECHSLGMALTTPIKRTYWLGVSFALRTFSLPRKVLSLETKSPTLR